MGILKRSCSMHWPKIPTHSITCPSGSDSIDFKLSGLSVAASGSGLYPPSQLQLNTFLEPAVSQCPSLVGRIPDFVYLGFRNGLIEQRSIGRPAFAIVNAQTVKFPGGRR